MKQIELKEIQKIELDILKYIDDICQKNGIDYTVVGGTALGTIRHNGFIPWDDDIDIGLTAKNYYKLLEILKKDKNNQYKLLDPTVEETYLYPFAKLIDTRTSLVENNQKPINNYGIYVDIFLYYGLPNNKWYRLLYFYNLKKYQLYFSYMLQEKIPNSDGVKGCIKKIIKWNAKRIGKEKLIKRFEKLCNKYPIEKSDYCTSNWPCVSRKYQILYSDVFKKTMRHKFESIEVNIMEKYDKYLTNGYGDYMKLPPVEKRKAPHPSDVHWRKKTNERTKNKSR